MVSLYYTEIGQLLRKAREELRLTLQESSASLHIRVHYLHALEVGELVNLPGAAYAKGYLQSYSAFLGLDKDEILRRFELVKDDIPEKDVFFPQVFSKEKKPSRFVVWGGILLVVLVYSIWFLLFKPSSSLSPAIMPPPSSNEIIGKSANVSSMLNRACILPQARVYPPCYRVENGEQVNDALLPLHRQVVSVMELSDLFINSF